VKILGNLDLVQNQLLNIVLQNTAIDLTNLLAGQIWYNTTSNNIKFYNGTNILTIATNVDIANVNTSIANANSLINNIISASGLTSTGLYFANTNAHYINNATSLTNADTILDTTLYTVATNLANEINNRTAITNTLSTEVNNIIQSSGFAGNGLYNQNTTAHFIQTATSLNQADVLLDKAIYNLANNLASSTFQQIYNQTPPDSNGNASFMLSQTKGFYIYDYNNTNAYFAVDTSGDVLISGNLIVKGSTVTINSTVTSSDHMLLSPAGGSTEALLIQPQPGVSYSTNLVDFKISYGGPSSLSVLPSGYVQIPDLRLTDQFICPQQTVTSETISGSTIGTYQLNHIQIIPGTVQLLSGTLTNGNTPVLGTDYTIDYINGGFNIINAFSSNPVISYQYHPAIDGRNIAQDGSVQDQHIAGTAYQHQASVIVYINSVTGIPATNVQSAIDYFIQNTNSNFNQSEMEINNIAQACGINTSFQYAVNTSANYINTAISLNNADVLLDSALKTVSNNLNTYINNISSTSSGLGAALIGIYGTLNNAAGATTVQSALVGFNTTMNNLATQITNLINTIGANTVNLVTFSSNNFVANGTTIIEAISVLDTALETYETNILSTSPNKGASLVGVSGTFVNAPGATNVQQTLASFDTNLANTGRRFLYTATNSGTSFVITHNLNYQYVNVVCYDSTTGNVVIPNTITANNSNTVTVTFTDPITPVIKIIA
jgi:hypothetical protein